MSTIPTVYLAVLGVGGVGRAFLFQLSALTERLKTSSNPVSVNLIYIATSRKSLISTDYNPLLHPSTNDPQSPEPHTEALLTCLQTSQTFPLNSSELRTFLSKAPGPVILIDNTASQGAADQYADLLAKGIHIVTPNKKAFSGPLQTWTAIKRSLHAASSPRAYIFHEASAGAGLPLLSSLTELVRAGDRIRRIEGVFSGTMSFLFNYFCPATDIADDDGGQKWSEIVKAAAAEGYTEPDPRDDLQGKDVARKLTIIARTVLDWPTELEDIPVQSMVPEGLQACASGDEFLQRLPEFDEEMERMRREFVREGKVLRYVGVLDVEGRELSVGVRRFDKTHPMALLKGSQKSISIYTERYGESALIFQGGSAAVELTAMTITGDLIKVLDRVV